MTERPDAEPPITASEVSATQLVLENAQFTGGLALRGVTDLKKVFCAPFSAGYYGVPRTRATARQGGLLRHAPVDDQPVRLADRTALRARRLRQREVLSVTD